MPKAAVALHTMTLQCPVLDGSAANEYRTAVKANNTFSLAVLEFLKGRAPAEQTAWIKTTVGMSRVAFQPWTMELVFTLAVLRRARFTQLLDLLGLSSRTLSDKLQTLREAGLIDRDVFDEQPVRIEYFLTKGGRKTAALAAPLFAHLNFQALRKAGKL